MRLQTLSSFVVTFLAGYLKKSANYWKSNSVNGAFFLKLCFQPVLKLLITYKCFIYKQKHFFFVRSDAS